MIIKIRNNPHSYNGEHYYIEIYFKTNPFFRVRYSTYPIEKRIYKHPDFKCPICSTWERATDYLKQKDLRIMSKNKILICRRCLDKGYGYEESLNIKIRDGKRW